MTRKQVQMAKCLQVTLGIMHILLVAAIFVGYICLLDFLTFHSKETSNVASYILGMIALIMPGLCIYLSVRAVGSFLKVGVYKPASNYGLTKVKDYLSSEEADENVRLYFEKLMDLDRDIIELEVKWISNMTEQTRRKKIIKDILGAFSGPKTINAKRVERETETV